MVEKHKNAMKRVQRKSMERFSLKKPLANGDDKLLAFLESWDTIEPISDDARQPI